MTSDNLIYQVFIDWYDDLRKYKQNNGFPARGTIATALVVIERLKTEFNLNLEFHRKKGTGQLRGVSGQAVAKILSSFGETRPFLSEGGRTNRGGPEEIRKMLIAVEKLKLK